MQTMLKRFAFSVGEAEAADGCVSFPQAESEHISIRQASRLAKIRFII